MKNDRGEITIDGFHDTVLPLTAWSARRCAALPLDLEAVKRSLDLTQFDQPLDRGFFERLSAGRR